MTHSLHVIFGVTGHGTKIPSDTRYFSNYFAIRETKKGSSPWELGSGRVSLATKCMTVVRPGGNFRAATKKWVIKMCQMIIHQPYFQVSTFVSMWKRGFNRKKVAVLCGEGLTSQGNVAMQEAPLEDEAQYAGTAHPLLLPSCHRAQKQGHHLMWPTLKANSDSAG